MATITKVISTKDLKTVSYKATIRRKGWPSVCASVVRHRFFGAGSVADGYRTAFSLRNVSCRRVRERWMILYPRCRPRTPAWLHCLSSTVSSGACPQSRLNPWPNLNPRGFPPTRRWLYSAACSGGAPMSTRSAGKANQPARRDTRPPAPTSGAPASAKNLVSNARIVANAC